MVVLDTDVLTLMQRKHGERYARLAARIESAGQEIYVTIVSFEEQMRRWLAACAKARTPERYAMESGRLQEMLLDFGNRAVLPFDLRSATEFKRLKSARVNIGTMDLRIACIVLIHDATLITMNRRDYDKVPFLRVEDWTRAAR
jgi:tRNA(fMet)-specific endonuclease VapC